MNLPNKLTVFRMILVPIFILIGYIGIPGELLGISTTFWVMNLNFNYAYIKTKKTHTKYGG